MKITFVLWGFSRSGGTRVIFEVATRLARKGHSVSLVGLIGSSDWFQSQIPCKKCFDLSSIIVRATKYTLSQITSDRLTLPVDKLYWKHQCRILAKNIPKSDIVVATYCLTAFPVIMAGKGIPFYYVQHYEPLFFSDIKFRKLATATYNLPINFLVVSRWLENILKERFSKQSTVVGNGVDHTIFNASVPRVVLKEKPNETIVMSFLRGIWWKGDIDFLLAAKEVAAQLNNVRFILVGRRPLLERYRKLIPGIQGLSMTVFEQPTDSQLASLYASSDIFVSSSWYEGFCLPPLEAMACGTSVITTDSLGVRDYVVHEKNAIVVPPKQPSILARAIIQLVKDDQLRKELSKNGLDTAKKFSYDKVAEKVERAFLNAMN